jgi:hypothetical protein
MDVTGRSQLSAHNRPAIVAGLSAGSSREKSAAARWSVAVHVGAPSVNLPVCRVHRAGRPGRYAGPGRALPIC